jgi:hypothetical protein
VGRSYANLKYKLIKGMRNRALTFKDRADTPEKREAWAEVVTWMDSFLRPEYRILTKNGAIGLPVGLRKIDEVFRLPSEDIKNNITETEKSAP